MPPRKSGEIERFALGDFEFCLPPEGPKRRDMLAQVISLAVETSARRRNIPRAFRSRPCSRRDSTHTIVDVVVAITFREGLELRE
jgi:hypothetical protein